MDGASLLEAELSTHLEGLSSGTGRIAEYPSAYNYPPDPLVFYGLAASIVQVIYFNNLCL